MLTRNSQGTLVSIRTVSKISGKFIPTATQLINILPSNHLHNKWPYELLYNKKPSYNQLRSFGCLCYPTVPKVHENKFGLRTTPHVFVGYTFGT